MGKRENSFFSEPTAASDLKASRSSYLIEYMKVCCLSKPKTHFGCENISMRFEMYY